MELPHELDRTVLIAAARSTVFSFFTDPARFASWWGEGSHIEARPGGAVSIHYPNGVVARGEVLEVAAGERIVFTFGYEGEEVPVPPGASRVTVTLEEVPEGTRVHLRHAFADPGVRDAHVPGWRHHLGVFANVAAAAQHGDGSGPLGRWFQAWAESDAGKRRALLEEAVTEDVVFMDAFACIHGLEELAAHIEAARMHMQGVSLVMAGPPAQCQGNVAVRWVARGADGSQQGQGLNTGVLTPDGRLARVVGLWGAA